ncbi:MAG TPA: alpha/beta hydrolase [Vicinamibacterales bacterium]|nr:alpha/beta hydrolase [Vicinamibacterales bacterium]
MVAFDPKGDGFRNLADAAQLGYRYEADADMLWLRLALYEPSADAGTLRVTIAIDTGADEARKVNWQGANKAFRYDRLLKVSATHVDGLPAARVQRRFEADSIVIGIARRDLTESMQLRVLAALDSNGSTSDELMASINLAAARPSRGLMEIDTARNNLQFAARQSTLPVNAIVSAVRSGRGRDTLVLIPGVYSGRTVFDSFVARNRTLYTTYLVTPAGLNGTTSRALPPEAESYGQYRWTRAVESDVRTLIERERLERPIIVTHGFPGSLVAQAIAATSPELIGGVIHIASIAIQAAPSFREPGKAAALEERIAIVDDAWVNKWFKYVTPETWESNNYPAAMLANDPDRAERARTELEAAPLEVKIRYLAEFMASDQSKELLATRVPMLVLKPGFDDKTLAEPANAFFKVFFLDSWNAFASNPKIELLTIPNARALLLDDQPKAADDAIAAFVAARRR